MKLLVERSAVAKNDRPLLSPTVDLKTGLPLIAS